MNKDKKIVIFGADGMVGSALGRELKKQGFQNIFAMNRQKLDLLNQSKVDEFFKKEKPELIFMAAAKVGGIQANINYPSEFLYENLMLQNNVFKAAHTYSVNKMIFFSSACVYPIGVTNPIKEESLLTGEVEPTNEAYAIAKIAGMKLIESYRNQYRHEFLSVVPANLYGPNDNYHPENSHVMAGMITRMLEAKKNNESNFLVWGSGEVKREFLHVDDLAVACIYLMEKNLLELPSYINIGSGEEVTIKELAMNLKELIGFDGNLVFDRTKPEGIKQKLLDSQKIRSLGWKPEKMLSHGLSELFSSF